MDMIRHLSDYKILDNKIVILQHISLSSKAITPSHSHYFNLSQCFSSHWWLRCTQITPNETESSSHICNKVHGGCAQYEQDERIRWEDFQLSTSYPMVRNDIIRRRFITSTRQPGQSAELNRIWIECTSATKDMLQTLPLRLTSC